MNRLALISLIPLALATPVAAQTMDHSSMPGMAMPAQPAKPAQKAKPRPKAKPAAAPARRSPQPKPASSTAGSPPAAPMDHSAMPGMTMPALSPTAPAQDHNAMPGMPAPAGAAPQDHSAMPGMQMGPMAQPEIPKSPPPPPPAARAADRFFPRAEMDRAVAELRREHGAVITSKFMTNLAEYQVRKGADGYRWDGQAWFGGDVNRLVLKSEGEGTGGQGVERADVQALYSRAVGVYTDLQVGVRQDFEAHKRTYATIGFESLAPYWFDVEGAVFLSDKGELLGRLEGTYDLRLTNRVILQPRAELNFAAQNSRETQYGSGLSNAELGLRLRYELRREFAPYIGLSWDRRFGKTAEYARALGEGVVDKSVVFGVRAFF